MSYEKIFEYDLDITGVTDYGADMEAMFTGRESVPLQGAQFDVTLAGAVKGRVTGAMRPDGRRELELRGSIETDDGNRIAFTAEGVGSPPRERADRRPGREDRSPDGRGRLFVGQCKAGLGFGIRGPGHQQDPRRGLSALRRGLPLASARQPKPKKSLPDR